MRSNGGTAQLVLAIAEATGGPDGYRFFRAPGRVNLMGDHTDYSKWALMTHDGDADRVPRPDKLRSGAQNDLEFLPDDLL